MPFPSGGCQTCKLRRIKCDETQPVCGRCKKSQRTCYGMRNGPWCSVIHLENTYASGVAKRPRGPRSTRTAEPAGTLTILQLPATDLKTRAVTYFRHHHLETISECHDVSKTVYNDFLPVWMSKQDCTLLNLSGSCISLAIFSQTQRHPPAALEASLKYQKLLQTTQKSLLTLSAENIELYLIAIFCMGRYEGAIYRPNSFNSPGFTRFSHHSGALSILKIWKEQYSHLHPATDVIRHSRQGLIRSALLGHIELPDWMVDGKIFGEQGLDLEYSRIVIRIIRVRQKLVCLLQNYDRSLETPNAFASLIDNLIAETDFIDTSLQEYSSLFPKKWRHSQHPLPDPHPWPMRDFYTPTVRSYSSPAQASSWCSYYAIRILINSTKLKILELSEPCKDAEDQRLQALSCINIMADNLASSIPFILERCKITSGPRTESQKPSIALNIGEDIKPSLAMLLVWPLTLAASVSGVDARQQKWFRSELARVGRIVGYGIIECAETDQWPVNHLNFDRERGMDEY
ncbi:hypothetical protein N431DRAFT_550744 [Stipitochalara longipes BDJ]|nr:hypothetical protein N431DRAFT_550744 [Stipitochalara longipes BDJ]